MVEKLKPMPGWLRRYAELADRGLDPSEIAVQLNVKTETIRKRYDPAYRNYINLAKERLLEFYNQGVDLEEAAARVKEELNLTDAMIVKALDLAREDVGLKSSEVRGWRSLGGRVRRLQGGF